MRRCAARRPPQPVRALECSNRCNAIAAVCVVRARQHRRLPSGGAPPGRGSLALGSLAAAPVPTSGLIERRRVCYSFTAAGIFTTLK
jgi:hypothetical protein